MKILPALVLLALLLPMAACGEDDDTPGTTPDRPTRTASTGQTGTAAPEQPAELVSWSESTARDQSEWLNSHMQPRLIEGPRIAQFVAGLPEQFAGEDALETIDTSTTALLVAGFSECANAGEASIEDGTVTYRVRKTDDYVCAWAPVRVQVFAIPAGVTLAQ
ncbi:hypothetical protein [Nocardioides alcanivorans]|uniref:hypothetical protein n=1 Tax=Nocardioides alcanivorans TaxID=2897352 RepID=UPI001F4552DF|nr:hypothetical protein [Nocardioides alcanivorans]